MKKIFLLTIVFYSLVCSSQNKSESEDILKEANELIKNEQWGDAEKKLSLLIKFYPNSPGLYFKRGYVNEMNLKYQECINDFTRAISLQPGIHTARTNRGYAYRMLGQYKKAIKDFTAELVVNPNAYSYEHRSYVYYLLKEYDNALLDINISIKKEPTNSIAFKTRALIFMAMDNKESACADLEKALELNIEEKDKKYKIDILNLKEYCIQ